MKEVGVVDTGLAAATLSGRGARVYTCTFVLDNIPCRRLPKYRPIGASLLTTSPQQGCLALKGLHTGWLGVVTGIRLIHIIVATTAERHGGYLVIL